MENHEEPIKPELSEAQKKELDRRIAEVDAQPQNVLTWEEIKKSIRRSQ